MKTTPAPDAFFFDMDGTLVNTEPYWARSQRNLLASQGIEWRSELDELFTGQSLETMAMLMQAEGLDMPAEEIISQTTSEVFDDLDNQIPWRPGAREFLQSIREAGFKTAMVTMSWSQMANFVADHMGFDAFDTVVSGDLVANGKPHPEPYLLAAEQLESRPQNSIAFEDSPPGLKSAISANMHAVFVPCGLEIPSTPDFTRWETLTGRSVLDAVNLYKEKSSND